MALLSTLPTLIDAVQSTIFVLLYRGHSTGKICNAGSSIMASIAAQDKIATLFL